MMYNASKCIHCGDCRLKPPPPCPTGARQIAGKTMETDEIMDILERERSVVESSGGGVTISGGEPLLQHEYTFALMDEVKARLGYHRAIDTSLFTTPEVAREATRHCELMLIDLKHMDSSLHQRYTGVPNERILSNIRLVSEMGHPFWVRIPLIVGVNADERNLRDSALFLASLPTAPLIVNLLPYHELGKGKHQRMGTEYNPQDIDMKAPTEEGKDAALRIFQDAGLNVSIGG